MRVSRTVLREREGAIPSRHSPDWGGWYDHYLPAQQNQTFPYHPFPNAYGNNLDPNEWGFRVPMLVISPYVAQPATVSDKLRGQGSILRYIERTFALGSLGTDDAVAQNDDLSDMINFKGTPILPYVKASTTFNGIAPPSCFK